MRPPLENVIVVCFNIAQDGTVEFAGSRNGEAGCFLPGEMVRSSTCGRATHFEEFLTTRGQARPYCLSYRPLCERTRVARELADDLDSTPRNITGLVDHLERDGLVERFPDPTDRRSVRARLTEEGRKQIDGIWKEGLEHQFTLVEGLSKEDLAQLRHLCLKLVENARKELGK